MSAKKFKAIRQQLRSHGVDPKDVGYKDRYGFMGRLVQRNLNPVCGRAMYHAAKERMYHAAKERM